MPTKNLKQIFSDPLFRVAETTFGELAFMLVMPDDLGMDEELDHWGYGAKVDFTGPFNGELYVVITEEMMEPLAANMLGLEIGEEPPEGVLPSDALKELLNVICGNLLPEVAGVEVVFHIAGPELLETPEMPTAVEGMAFVDEVEMLLDSGKARIALFVDKDADPEGLK